MKKRIITKVGFVYKTKDTSKGQRYLQLVAIDQANMNSDVIVVFAPVEKYVSSDLEQIVKSPMEFYTHTTVSQGVREGLWEKVGKVPVDVDLSRLTFKYYRDQVHIDSSERVSRRMDEPKLRPPFTEPYWTVWTLPDKHYHHVSGTEGAALEGEPGAIFTASSVLYRIENGHYRYTGWLK